jgi:tetratricopeptide (TPR) repeat protein
MRVLRRLFAREANAGPGSAPPVVPDRWTPSSSPPPLEVVLCGGSHDLEVVGESHYQDALWRVVGGRTTERVRREVRAVLVAESDNPYDPNAISVWIDGLKVGHLSREDAEAYRPGLLALQARKGKSIGLRGVVVGGGIREDGPGFLGVWMSHDPADFGIAAIVPPPSSAMRASMRTGLTEALLTDEEDDSYDLSWLERLPGDPIAAIGRLRQLLQRDPDPIDRHFMFSELEERLYRSRDAFSSALAEYDDACAQHDAEMDGIRDALLAKFGRVPLLETYRQMAVRQQKARNWLEAIRWAERGLALYGENAARPEAVDDLRKRVAAYRSKLSAGDPARPPRVAPAARERADEPATETLTCANCGRLFDRPVARGRKPKHCPSCR